MRDVEIVITDRSGAAEILCSPSRCAEFAYIVSIGDPGESPPAGWRDGPHCLRLEFQDRLLESDGGPTKRDVKRLIGFAREIDGGKGGILVHCQGGISRSTAAGAIILDVLLGPGRESDVLCEVYRLQPLALPNGRMLELADAALGRNGALLQAAALIAERAAEQGVEADEAWSTSELRSLTPVLSGHFAGGTMDDRRVRVVASVGLAVGAVLGMAGTFAPSPSLRGLAWGIDGVALVMASALLTIWFYRKGQDLAATGFLVFVVGQGIILSSAAMDLPASTPSFGAGASLWALALTLISASAVFPWLVRGLGFFAAVLFAVTALQILAGGQVTPITSPLPFHAYPVFVATMAGWIWALAGRARPQ